MPNTEVTAICNVYITSESKFTLFQETFPRTYGISDNWLINIRGKYRDKVLDYIRSTFPDTAKRCTFFSGLSDSNWAKSTQKMLTAARYDYIYVFLEDHFLLKPLSHFQDVIRDMAVSKIDYVGYSFFNVGLSTQSAEGLYPDYSKHFFSFELTESRLSYLKKNNHHFYPHSLASICTKQHFESLLDIEQKQLLHVPFLVQAVMENCFFPYPRNRAFWFNANKIVSPLGLRFVIYPPATPFNLEKSLFDCNKSLLPLKVGGLQEELFANWDDDNILSNSSLMKRGLYPETFRPDRQPERHPKDGKDYTLKKGQHRQHRYCPEVSRMQKPPMKFIHVKKGSLGVSAPKETFTLQEGESTWVYANIPHTLLAHEDCVFQVHIDD